MRFIATRLESMNVSRFIPSLAREYQMAAAHLWQPETLVASLSPPERGEVWGEGK